MTYNGIVMNFTYDAAGTPLTIEYNGTLYYYVTNLQGDVVGILDGGNLVVQYFYNAWGYIMRQTGSLSATLGDQNPLRYRGYVYDPEYKLYYLESRYYNPGLGRFQNADAFTSTGQGLLGNNMYIYCGNNPVNLQDPAGNLPINSKQFGVNALYHGGGNYDGGIIPDKVREAAEARRKNLNPFNTDESVVLNAESFAFYKGVPVVKVPFMGTNAFSFGIIFMGKDVKSRCDAAQTVRHEYGHAVHFYHLGIEKYFKVVAIPSVIGYWFDVDDYYSQPWEYIADVLGGVNRTTPYGSPYQYSSSVAQDTVVYLIASLIF